ncbi:MAG: metal-sensitive transcriptional regulator [Proteobacteria bacterium]|nr:metal-sensitive transcriptional regulator [Pseudomonadota bacterium]MDA0976849.1 metal-sensitive transcriptional regulator [Pseudomonadota bacterium]MDA1037039.1 metal-sensitive transcriptional regulator [Pseudomonadota bacterium]
MSHPCHKEQIASIKRVEGQIRGILKMIEDGKYCIDILNQLKAVKNAISTVEGKILKNHLQACVKDALTDSNNFDDKVDELLKTLKR